MFCFFPKHNIACLMKIQNYESKKGAISAINLLHARIMFLVYPATQVSSAESIVEDKWMNYRRTMKYVPVTYLHTCLKFWCETLIVQNFKLSYKKFMLSFFIIL